MKQTLISSDSHITEPPTLFVERIEAKYRDQAPHLLDLGERGDFFALGDPLPPVPVGIIAAAGKDPTEIRAEGVRFTEMHPGGWDPAARLGEQDRDGVSAEIIYPTVGMMICNHPDFDYKRACFRAYNSWMAEYAACSPDRLVGLGQIAMHDPKEAIRDLEEIARLGLRGVMMPGEPAVEDYDSPIYDDFYRASLALGLPLSFHILTYKQPKTRGSRLNSFFTTIRGCQDMVGLLIFGGVFDRHPDLKVVCVEADAGWVPHYMYRMDHAYLRHRHWITPGQELARKPSEYFASNIFTTFQDDWSAFGQAKAGLLNSDQIMWANDFPHSDSTWPWSQPLLAQHSQGLGDEMRDKILYRNCARLYDIDLARIEVDKANLDPNAELKYNLTDIKHAGKLENLPSRAAYPSFVAHE